MSVLSSPAWQKLEPRAVDRFEIRCSGCGYGGVVAHIPDRCPMCGGATWRELSSRSGRLEQTPAAV